MKILMCEIGKRVKMMLYLQKHFIMAVLFVGNLTIAIENKALIVICFHCILALMNSTIETISKYTLKISL